MTDTTKTTEQPTTPPPAEASAPPAEKRFNLMPDMAPIVVPPLSELTMMIFGEPKSGKSSFIAGNPGVFFYATEPGQDFLRARKLYVSDDVRKAMKVEHNWEVFQQFVRQIWADKASGVLAQKGITNVAIDIVDNLYAHCLTFVCKSKGIEYPPESDFGKTWKEVRDEWEKWMRRLMEKVNVTFITHCTAQVIEHQLPGGMTKDVTRWQPTFKGNKAAQYLDGIVNAIGHVRKSVDGKYTISFKGATTSAAGDRTGILESLGDHTLDWKAVEAAYVAKAKELGFEIKGR